MIKKKERRDAADSIAAVEQRLIEMKERRVRELGKLIIKLLGPDVRQRQIAGLIRLGMKRFSPAEIEEAGRVDFPGRTTDQTVGGVNANAIDGP